MSLFCAVINIDVLNYMYFVVVNYPDNTEIFRTAIHHRRRGQGGTRPDRHESRSR